MMNSSSNAKFKYVLESPKSHYISFGFDVVCSMYIAHQHLNDLFPYIFSFLALKYDHL